MITATFEYTISEDGVDPIGSDFEFDTTTGTDGNFDSSTGPSFGSSVGSSTFDSGTLDPGATMATAADDPVEALGSEESQEVFAFTEGFAGPGFAYPTVWAVPLVILVGFAAVGRALTKELYRADD